MNRLKCRYCGGDIAPAGDGSGRCESCGSQVMLPVSSSGSADTELYNRANHLRQIHDYDGAISAYEHLAAANPADPEARWNLVLCKYGVEYTYDRRTNRFLPTINRMSLDSILEDRDYLLALKYSAGDAREEYRRLANELAAIQDELEAIVRENENYDVFISFKATDENRKRTRDFILAQEIYNALTADGLRVFFSPVSLREHVGEVYEPYIFAALYSAKVMVLVGTRKAYLESEWVRNEWSRYLFMTRENQDKHIVPVCEGMQPEDFPAGIGKMQAISMSTIGALELIRERVTAYTGAHARKVYVRTASGESVDLSNQMRRIEFDIEDGNYEDAAARIDRLRSRIGGKNADVEYMALLARYHVQDASALAAHRRQLERDQTYLWLLENGTPAIKKQLAGLQGSQSGTGVYGSVGAGLQSGQGARGNVGAQGVQSGQGARGNVGARGVQRVQGARGGAGAQGVQSGQGARGSAGAQNDEEQLIQQLTAWYKSADYSKIIRAVDEARRQRTLSREAEIQEIYQKARTLLQENEIKNAYAREVGDGKAYYLQCLKREDPERHAQITAALHTVQVKDERTLLDTLADYSGPAGLVILVLWLLLKETMIPYAAGAAIAFVILYHKKHERDWCSENDLRCKESPALIRKWLFTLIGIFAVCALLAFLTGGGWQALERPTGFSLGFLTLVSNLFADGDPENAYVLIYLAAWGWLIHWGFHVWACDRRAASVRGSAPRDLLDLIAYMQDYEEDKNADLAERYGEVYMDANTQPVSVVPRLERALTGAEDGAQRVQRRRTQSGHRNGYQRR